MKLEISIARQTLAVVGDDGQVLQTYAISTAAAGAGECAGSYQTPRGSHRIRAKIGGCAPLGAVFVGRRPTGEVWTPELAAAFPERDWILSRILWLCGNEPGRNRFGNCDSMRRYIYIHGCPDDAPMGVPRSHGCIRMTNADVAELFERVPVYTPVEISED